MGATIIIIFFFCFLFQSNHLLVFFKDGYDIRQDTDYQDKYPAGCQLSVQISGQIPDIWKNIQPDNGYLYIIRPDTGYLDNYPARYLYGL